MKKMLMILLAMVLALSSAAYAEGIAPSITEIPMETEVQVDLGGDAPAAVSWKTMVTDEYGDSYGVALSIGGEAEWTLDYLFGAQVYAVDLDANGADEIYVSGDMASSDFYTYALVYENGEIRQLNFANVERGSDYEGYTDYGYGAIVNIGLSSLTLSGSQDVLGTRFADRSFTLKDGQFEIADDGLWYFNPELDNPLSWEYGALNPIQTIPATFTDDDGAAAEGELQPGEKILITASDCKTTAYFVTEDGREGFLTLEPNTELWGSLIGGIAEEDLFEYIPYAD